MKRGAACVVALSAMLLAGTASAQTPEAKAGARAAATQGNEAFGQKRWADSLDLFTRAEHLMHAPTHVLMIGRSHAALGHLVRAYEAFSSLAHETLAPNAPSAFKEAQADAAKELKAIEPRVPTLSVKVADATARNVTITMDGEPVPADLIGIARSVDPGVHVLKARADKLASADRSIRIEEGAHLVVALEMVAAPDQGPTVVAPPPAGGPPPPVEPQGPNRGLQIGGYVTLGLGVAGLVVGGVFTGLGFSKRGDANAAYGSCGPPCVNGSPQANEVKSLDSSANGKQTIGLVGFIAGGALAVTGVTLVVLSRRGSAGPTTGLVIGPGSVGALGSF